jgi:Icc protein
MSPIRRVRKRSKPLRLLQFTDLHLSPDESGRVRGVATRESFASCLAHARRHHAPVDALLLTGDLVQDDARGYLALQGLLAAGKVPVHCLPGNHDLPREMEALLGRPPFDLSAVLRYGPWTLVQLDSTVAGQHAGRLAPESLAFLDDVLARFSDSHALVVLHHQPVPIGSAWLDAIGLENGPQLLEVLGRHRNVRGLLWGHAHQAYDALHAGLTMMCTPSTCFQFVPKRDDFAVDDKPPGYRWLHLYPDGRIQTEVVWVSGE